MSLMNYPSIEQVVAALGKHTGNPEVIALMSTLEISESDLKQTHADLNDYKFWADHNTELKLEFQDIGSLTDIPYHDIGEGPWVLTAVVYWSDINKGIERSYGGPLPYGITFEMKRENIKSLISKPLIIEEEDIDVWQIGELELVLDYNLKSKKIRCISLGLPPPPLSE